jgi:hypothetical protein
MTKTFLKSMSIAAFAVCALPVWAQDEPVIDPSQLTVITPSKSLINTLQTGHPTTTTGVVPALPLWQYAVTSPIDGNIYLGSMVGGNPFNRAARTTPINLVLVPLRIQFTGTVRNFDPTSPDVGCLGAGNTGLSLSQASPLFNTVPNLTMNGVNLGTVTFPDAFQRAEFNAVISPAYHLAFNVTTAGVQTISMANNSAGSGATFSFGSGGCSTNAATTDNPGGSRAGFVDINFMDAQLNSIIVSLGLNANQFPLFVTYGVYMTDGPPGTLSGNCCILGYHSTVSNTPTTAQPGQTYGIGPYDQGWLFGGVKDITAMSHEVLEWVNDPSTNNLVPEWGHIGQVGGCVVSGSTHTPGQNNLEVGDPLSGNLNPAITMTNGVTYHPQELAFYSWFLGGTSLGAGGFYSSNGTFKGFAKPCATGGGTN